ncbi:MAG TPA: helix-turn-helix domain-containing protein [Anaerolineales bacterium]|nr:helix-turn-helix domain-containing protein [Anaerolineales bacterium]
MGDTESKRSTFGKWLRQQRRALDLTQEAFADQVGCARITLRRIESGELKPSKELALILLAKAGIPAHEREAWLPFTRGLSPYPATQKNPLPSNFHTNLPASLTRFIGREKEREEVLQLIAGNRLVMLTGSGGVGKTRLSIQVASELLSDFPIGVWLVELAPLTNPALVPQSVCATLSVKPDGGVTEIEALIHYIHNKKILLVLDNCEHLIDACAQLCDSLLRSCPDLHILASSREALDILGEQTYRVPSLSLPDSKSILNIIRESEAVTLFVERAKASQFDFELTEFNASFVAQICLRLDGIALAIELAASRIKTFKVEQIAERLNNVFDLLTSGNRTALPRQQTLRTLIDWSYNLLPDGERIFLLNLSVFMGGWTLKAAEAVCGNADALDLLTRLVDKSLVSLNLEQGDEPRYYLLETVRQYTHEKLMESGEEHRIREYHLEYFAKLAEGNHAARRSAEQKSAFRQMNIELDNFRAALNWSFEEEDRDTVTNGLRIANMLDWAEAPDEGLKWLQQGVASIPRGNPEFDLLRADAMTNTAPMLINKGEFESAIETLNQCIEIYQSINPIDKRGWVTALYLIAWAIMDSNYATARVYAQASVAMARETGDATKWELAMALQWDGCIAYRSTEYESGISLIREGFSIFREVGDEISAADMLHIMGQIEASMEHYAKALEYYQQAKDIKAEYGLKASTIFILNDMFTAERRLGNYASARTKVEECIAYLRDMGTPYHLAGSLWQLGDVLISLGELDEAANHLRESLQISRQLTPSRYIGYCLFSLIKLLHQQGRSNDTAQLLGSMELETKKDFWQFTLYRKRELDQTVEAVKAILGESEFAQAYTQGKAMTLDQGVAYALEMAGKSYPA